MIGALRVKYQRIAERSGLVGRVLAGDRSASRWRARHIISCLVLVNPGRQEIVSDMAEKCWFGREASIQTNTSVHVIILE